MKILIPVNFTTVSRNAWTYGIFLAKTRKAQVTLMHCVDPSNARYSGAEEPLPRTAGEAEVRLSDLATSIKAIYPKLEVVCQAVSGDRVKEIMRIAEDGDYDLIVLGNRHNPAGVSEYPNNLSAVLARKCRTPLLIVPEHVGYRRIRKMVFASDYSYRYSAQTAELIRKFVGLFKAELLILEVQDRDSSRDSENTRQIQKVLGRSAHRVEKSFHEDIAEAIDYFDHLYRAELLVMVPQRHHPLTEIFHESNTKKMLYTSEVPILSIHD